MNLVDSSAWLAFFLDDPKAAKIVSYVSPIERVLVPSLVVYEVMRQVLKRRNLASTRFIVNQLLRGTVVSADTELAMQAAPLSLRHGLGSLDALIYATVLRHQATLITLDNDFRGLAHVKVF